MDRSDLRPKQRAVIAEMVASEGLLLIVPMGGGKTVCTLTAFRDSGARAMLVVAPKAVAETTWPNEVARWEHLRDLRVMPLTGTKAQRDRKLRTEADVYVASLNVMVTVLEELARLPWHPARDLLVIDEISKLASPRGVWSKAARKHGRMFTRVWGLTGTPRPRGWEDWWSQLQIVSNGRAFDLSFDNWRRAYFRPLDPKGYNWAIHTFAQPLIQRVIDTWAVAVPPAEADTLGFHDGDGHDRWFDLTEPQLEALNTLNRKALVELGLDFMPPVEAILRNEALLHAFSRAVAVGKMEQVLQGFLYDESGKLIQSYPHNRANALIDLTEEANENLLIAYRYAQDVENLREAFGDPNLPVIGGGRGDTAKLIAAWNAGDLPVLAIHPLAGGHGLNLQHGGRRVVWYANTWSAEEYEQLVARLARPGQTLPVYSHRLRARHWLEDLKIARAQMRRVEQADAVSAMKTVKG
jgi:hypothetical protein